MAANLGHPLFDYTTRDQSPQLIANNFVRFIRRPAKSIFKNSLERFGPV